MSPQVSVLLPTHNAADIVGFAIRSALAQTFKDFELLVVGDGCTDHTASVVQAFADDRVKWFDYPKAPGFGYANRNRVLREARGEVIAYLSHDDLWFSDHLQRMVECLQANDAEFAYSQLIEVSLAGDIEPRIFNLHDPVARHLWLTRYLGYVASSNVVHRRSCFAKYGFWNEKMQLGGDWDLWMRIVEGGQCQNFAYLPMPTGLHFVGPWRRDAAPWKRALWRRVRAWEASAPGGLCLDAPDARSQQAAAWEAMQGGHWVCDLRRAAQVDRDRRSNTSFQPTGLLEFAHRCLRRVVTPRRHALRSIARNGGDRRHDTGRDE